MAQHDFNIANAGGATVRADINNVLAAIQSSSSGTSAPSSTVAGMLWLDTSGGLPYALKIRDGGNNHWLTIGTVDDPGADKGMEINPSKINLPTSGGIFESDGSTEILTESSGAVTLKNTTLDSTVSMESGVKTSLNASGSAPIYACRAWVNFNGQSTVSIRGSGNVSSITDNGTSDYTVNLTTAMSDINYGVCGFGQYGYGPGTYTMIVGFRNESSYSSVATTSSLRVVAIGHDGNTTDPEMVSVNIFR